MDGQIDRKIDRERERVRDRKSDKESERVREREKERGRGRGRGRDYSHQDEYWVLICLGWLKIEKMETLSSYTLLLRSVQLVHS